MFQMAIANQRIVLGWVCISVLCSTTFIAQQVYIVHEQRCKRLFSTIVVDRLEHGAAGYSLWLVERL